MRARKNEARQHDTDLVKERVMYEFRRKKISMHLHMQRDFEESRDDETDKSGLEGVLCRYDVRFRQAARDTERPEAIQPSARRGGWICMHADGKRLRRKRFAAKRTNDDIQFIELRPICDLPMCRWALGPQYRTVGSYREHIHTFESISSAIAFQE